MMDEIRQVDADPADEADDTPDVIVEEETGETIVQPPRTRRRLVKRILLALAALLVLLLVLLTLTAPLSKSLKPITAPSVVLLSVEGKPIARKGSVTDAPVDARTLPRHIPEAFLAIEDRRFYEHLGVDPWGIARAAVRNLKAGSVTEGGSTISQQLAKLAFLSSDQTAARKVQEAILALWLEAWLSKDEILSRYLSSIYFGDNVYGIRAAAKHYFNRAPEQLSVEQAALLAGLVKAPSTLAPTKNLKGARERGKVVEAAMVRAGFLDEKAAAALPAVTLNRGPAKDVPTGTYFADWLFANELANRDDGYGEQIIQTTLEDRLQREAVNAIRSVGTGSAQVALVSMRTDGRIVAMVGGKSYRRSPFNRVTQAKRQPGSTFKLFVYLAALRSGATPDDLIADAPIRVGNWTPQNYEGKYRGTITLREAFAFSSNVAAVQLSERIGREKVIQAARDLGITSELEPGPTVALGTSTVSLMEMTKAFAGVAAGSYPVEPHGLPQNDAPESTPFEGSVRDMMLQLLYASANQGTGRAAALPVQTFGKTGTSQESRDAYFIGFAGDIVTGVWIGHDDNRPMDGAAGGGVPAMIWRAFMSKAVTAGPAALPTALPAAPPPDMLPMTDAQLPAVYSDYDVDYAPAPGEPPLPGEVLPGDALPADVEPGQAPPPPTLDIPAPDAKADEKEEEPGPPRREVPTIAPPPPPPPQEEEEAPPDERA